MREPQKVGAQRDRDRWAPVFQPEGGIGVRSAGNLGQRGEVSVLCKLETDLDRFWPSLWPKCDFCHRQEKRTATDFLLV